MADFRSERMASPEGEGQALTRLEKAWGSYYETNRKLNRPIVDLWGPFLKPFAAKPAMELFGFWMAWQLLGGFDGVANSLSISRSGMYRRIALFRRVFGEHPDVYQFPGVYIDMDRFVRETAAKGKPTENSSGPVSSEVNGI